MHFQHKEQASGKWFKLSLCEQLANVGSEVSRAISWRNKGNNQYSQNAFWRALELLDLTVADPKNKKRLKEILRVREVLVDYFFGENEYQSTDGLWERYFMPYNWAARKRVT